MVILRFAGVVFDLGFLRIDTGGDEANILEELDEGAAAGPLDVVATETISNRRCGRMNQVARQ